MSGNEMKVLELSKNEDVIHLHQNLVLILSRCRWTLS